MNLLAESGYTTIIIGMQKIFVLFRNLGEHKIVLMIQIVIDDI
jgi:hypothetical protein